MLSQTANQRNPGLRPALRMSYAAFAWENMTVVAVASPPASLSILTGTFQQLHF